MLRTSWATPWELWTRGFAVLVSAVCLVAALSIDSWSVSDDVSVGLYKNTDNRTHAGEAVAGLVVFIILVQAFSVCLPFLRVLAPIGIGVTWIVWASAVKESRRYDGLNNVRGSATPAHTGLSAGLFAAVPLISLFVNGAFLAKRAVT